jgi:hypothetical protein
MIGNLFVLKILLLKNKINNFITKERKRTNQSFGIFGILREALY